MRMMKSAVVVLALSCCVAGPVQGAEVAGVDVHGFVTQGFVQTSRHNGYIAADSGKGSFKYNEFGINFGKELMDNLRIGMQLFAQDRGAYGRDKVTIDWAYGDYRFEDWLGIRAGRIKMPMGLYNETRDNDALRTFAILPQGIYDDTQRETVMAQNGVGIYGISPMTVLGKLAYQAQVGNIDMTTDGGVATIAKSSVFHDLTEISTDLTYAYSLVWSTPLDGLRISGTGVDTSFRSKGTFIGNPALATEIEADDFHRYVISAEYTWRDLVLAAEYLTEKSHQKGTIGPIPVDTYRRPESFYGSATYRVSDWLETGAYYSVYYADRLHHRTSATPPRPSYASWQDDLALVLRFDPMKNMLVKVEGHLMDGTALITFDNPNGAEKDWFLFTTKVSFNF